MAWIDEEIEHRIKHRGFDMATLQSFSEPTYAEILTQTIEHARTFQATSAADLLALLNDKYGNVEDFNAANRANYLALDGAIGNLGQITAKHLNSSRIPKKGVKLAFELFHSPYAHSLVK